MSTPRLVHATITEIHHLTETVYQLRFHIEGEVMPFIPGQYISLIIDQTTRRQYSICSAPQESPFFELVVDTAPMGVGSRYILDRKVGDTVQGLFPLGNFQLQQNILSKVFIATGTGIAPFRSMIASETVRNHTEDITLFWGLRRETDIYWKDWLEQQEKTDTHFISVLTLSRPDAFWKGAVGHVTEQLQYRLTGFAGTDFYLCGNRSMIQEVTAMLQEQHVPSERIKTDAFF